MFIANPIYDAVFKRLMENERVAKFFISTLLDETIEDIVVCPQERTIHRSDITNTTGTVATEATEEEMRGRENRILERIGISVLRYDFIATIKNPSGEYKKVLIEIQKAKDIIDLMRFRNYLAEQYKAEDEIEIDGIKRKTVLPIVTIYLLGFKLTEVDAIAFKVKREYWDLINQTKIEAKSQFVEGLTHDSYIVQIPRIVGKTRSKLERLLSLFEQNYFIDEHKIVKSYNNPVDEDGIREMLSILEHAGADPEQRKIIEDEQELYRVLEVMANKQEYEVSIKLKNKEIEENRKEIEEKDKVIEEKDKMIEELKRLLNEKK
ncbi:MAG: hypothetical protein LBT78_07020 [Tannerella sp.]|jgi:hypothetical protein|nr:hypothetical protein [Tannerella sp.]